LRIRREGEKKKIAKACGIYRLREQTEVTESKSLTTYAVQFHGK
jgi:hypothetical protein